MIKRFNLLPCPGCFAQEFEAGGDAWISGEAVDPDAATELYPAVLLHQPGHYQLECYTMQWILAGCATRRIIHQRDCQPLFSAQPF